MKKYCIDCNEEISPRAIRCNSCNNSGKRNAFFKSDKLNGENNPFHGKKHTQESK